MCAPVSVSLCLCARGWGGSSGSLSSACWRSPGALFPLAAESDAVRSKQSAKRTCAQRRGSACVMRGAALADLRTSSLKLAGEGRGGIVFQVNVVAGHPHLEPREEGDPARLHVGPRQRARPGLAAGLRLQGLSAGQQRLDLPAAELEVAPQRTDSQDEACARHCTDLICNEAG